MSPLRGGRLQVLVAALLISGTAATKDAIEAAGKPVKFLKCVVSAVHALPAESPDVEKCPADAWKCMQRVGRKDPACVEPPAGICGCLELAESFLPALTSCCSDLSSKRHRLFCKARTHDMKAFCTTSSAKLLANLDDVFSEEEALVPAVVAVEDPHKFRKCVAGVVHALPAESPDAEKCPEEAWKCMHRVGRRDPACAKPPAGICGCLELAESYLPDLSECCSDLSSWKHKAMCKARTHHMKGMCSAAGAELILSLGDVEEKSALVPTFMEPSKPFRQCVAGAVHALPAENPDAAKCPEAAWKCMHAVGRKDPACAKPPPGICGCLEAAESFLPDLSSCCSDMSDKLHKFACKALTHHLKGMCSDSSAELSVSLDDVIDEEKGALVPTFLAPSQPFRQCVAGAVRALPAENPDAAKCPATAWKCMSIVGKRFDPACEAPPRGICGCLQAAESFLPDLGGCCSDLTDKKHKFVCKAFVGTMKKGCSISGAQALLSLGRTTDVEEKAALVPTFMEPSKPFRQCVAGAVHALPAENPDAAKCPEAAWKCMHAVGRKDPACAKPPPGICGCLEAAESFLSDLSGCCSDMSNKLHKFACKAITHRLKGMCSSSSAELSVSLDDVIDEEKGALVPTLIEPSQPFRQCVAGVVRALPSENPDAAKCPASAWKCMSVVGRKDPACKKPPAGICGCLQAAESFLPDLADCCADLTTAKHKFACKAITGALEKGCSISGAQALLSLGDSFDAEEASSIAETDSLQGVFVLAFVCGVLAVTAAAMVTIKLDSRRQVYTEPLLA